MAVRRRRASHAGSWYDSSPDRLRKSMTGWMSTARASRSSSSSSQMPVYAIIAPHAGFSYSGKTAAYAYEGIDPSKFSRVILLGPSHHVYLKDRCAISDAHVLETPLGDLNVDRDVVEGLLEHSDSKARFVKMGQEMDEAEHSIEMHLPFVRHVFQNDDVKVVPIVVGSLSTEKEQSFGRVLSSWIGDGETFFIVSSDFCHWGTRFGFAPIDEDADTIWQGIEKMDREGMTCIETGDHGAFCNYIHRTRNTVCGRHPIGVLMSALSYCQRHSGREFATRFVKYDQSSKCVTERDSSVSYASALVRTCGSPTRSTSRRRY